MNSRVRMLVALLPLVFATTARAADPTVPHETWPNRGRLGMEVQSMTDALRQYFGAPPDRGVLVVRVLPDRAAGQAGLQVGDVVTAAGGQPIPDPLALITAVAHVASGEKLALEVVRKGETQTIDVAPEGDPVAFTAPQKGAPGNHGDLHDEMTRGLQDGTREILRHLEGIERRLDRLEHKKSGAPGEERT